MIGRPPANMQRLPLLDGLRGLAAILVLGTHVWSQFGIGRMFARGYLMVDLFFLLSGFVLALVAEPRMRSGWPALSFLKTRYIRLWPMVAVGAGLGIATAVVQLFVHGFSPSQAKWLIIRAAFALAILPTPRIDETGTLYPFNGQHWSLFMELLANCAHALILHRLRDGALLCVTVFFGALLAASIHAKGLNTAGPFFADWHYGLLRVGFSYPLGIWLARKWRDGHPRLSVPWWPVSWWPVPWSIALALPIAVTLLVPFLPVAQWIGDAALTIVIYPALFWIVVSSTPPVSAEPWLARLGLLSYPLYATHGAFFVLASVIGTTASTAALIVVMSLALAWCLASRFERRRTHELARATS